MVTQLASTNAVVQTKNHRTTLKWPVVRRYWGARSLNMVTGSLICSIIVDFHSWNEDSPENSESHIALRNRRHKYLHARVF